MYKCANTYVRVYMHAFVCVHIHNINKRLKTSEESKRSSPDRRCVPVKARCGWKHTSRPAGACRVAPSLRRWLEPCSLSPGLTSRWRFACGRRVAGRGIRLWSCHLRNSRCGWICCRCRCRRLRSQTLVPGKENIWSSVICLSFTNRVLYVGR